MKTVGETQQHKRAEKGETAQIDYSTKTALRDGHAASRIENEIDEAVVMALRNKWVAGAARKLDGLMNIAKEHKAIGALILLDVDLPVAFPAAAAVANSLYGLTPQMLLFVELIDTAALFTFEYGIVKGATATYSRIKKHFVAKYTQANHQ